MKPPHMGTANTSAGTKSPCPVPSDATASSTYSTPGQLQAHLSSWSRAPSDGSNLPGPTIAHYPFLLHSNASYSMYLQIPAYGGSYVPHQTLVQIHSTPGIQGASTMAGTVYPSPNEPGIRGGNMPGTMCLPPMMCNRNFIPTQTRSKCL